MRLIDADKLMEDIIKICKCQPYLEGMQSEIVYIQDVVDEQPTAFDVDKVVSELEDYKMWKELLIYDLDFRERQIIKRALEIVWKGGIDENKKDN